MPNQFRRFTRVATPVLACTFGAAGPAAEPRPPAPTTASPLAPMPAALADGQRIEWSDLQPALAEAVGGLILEEVVLERALEAEVARLGLKLPEDAPEAERALLGRALAAAARVPEEESETLVAQVRRSRGLGEVRFASLLKRNGLLRAIVRSGRVEERAAEVTDDDLRQAYALKHGPRVRVRLVLVRTQEEADTAITRLGSGESFSDLAARVSVDPSGARGGLIEPFSLDDANYPVAIRRVLTGLEPGQVSDPVAVAWGESQGFAVVRLEARVPPRGDAPTPEAAAESLREEVRLVRERAAMDRLARRLIAETKVTVFDRPLDQSWRERNEPVPGGR